MNSTDLHLILGVLSIPTGLLIAVGITGWGYRRSLARSMARTAQSPGLSIERAPARVPPAATRLAVQRVDPGDVRAEFASIEQEEAGAWRITRKVRAAHVAAAVTYVVIVDMALLLANRTTTMPLDVGITMVFLLLLPEISIVIWLVRYRLRTRLAVLAGYAFAGVVLALLLASKSRIGLLPILFATCALYPLAGVLLLTMKRLQPLLVALVAMLSFEAIGVAILKLFAPPLDLAALSDVKAWMFVAGVMNLVLGVIVFGWLVRRRRSIVAPVVALAALTGIGVAADRLMGMGHVVGALIYGAPLSVLQVSVVWLIFKGFVWLQGRHLLSAQVLHSHLCWGWFTLYLAVIVVNAPQFFGNGSWLPWTLGAAFCCYLAVLHASLWRLRVANADKPGKRLLLLRTFGSADKRERLLDALDDTWRRIGRIDLIAGADLAMRGLASTALEAFLLRRLDDAFLKTSDDVDRRLKRLRSAPEGDVRFPVNTFNCYASAWQSAVMRLASNADAILLDLRGFTRTNEGCAFELAYLVQHADLQRVVVLVDSTTDMSALEDLAQAAWANVPPDSPNAQVGKPELIALNHATQSEIATRALFLLLLRAASPACT